MTVAEEQAAAAEAAVDIHLFRKSLPLQVRLHELLRSLGEADGLSCLAVGSRSGTLCRHLQRAGGQWTFVVRAEDGPRVSTVLGSDVQLIKNGSLPFKKKLFDAVVLFDYLESTPDDDGFIEECHRVLRPDGRLVLNVAHVKPLSTGPALRKLARLTDEARGFVREGYSEPELFALLKHGFDVLNMRSYSRFFVQFVDSFVQGAECRARANETDPSRKLKRIHSIAAPFYRLAYQLDFLLFPTRGHYLIATAKRRTWRPRKAPVLVDGRSISEAVLSKALD